MIASDAVELIQDELGFRTDQAAKILKRLQQAQDFFERNWIGRPLPWFLLTERASTSTVGDEERVEIPANFIEEYEGDGIWLVDENGGEHLLVKNTADSLRLAEQERTNYGQNASPSEVRPRSYALTGKYWRLFPKPAQVWTLKQMYYGNDDLIIDTSTENNWLKYAPYVLIGWAGERMAVANRDDRALGIFRDWKAGAIGALQNALIEREMANRQGAMGEVF